MIVKMIQNLEIKMESQKNSLETRIKKMHERFNKDLEETKQNQYVMNNAIVKVKVKLLSRAQLFATPWIVACTKLLRPWDFQGKSTGVGCHFLLQGIFPTQGSNPGLSHCRQMLYCLSHQGSPTSLLTQYQLQSQSLNHSPE